MSVATHPTPEKIMKFTFGFVGTRALQTAVELDLFTLVQQGATSVAELARRADASERGISMMAQALAAMGLMTYDKGALGLTPDSEMFLVKTSQAYMGPLATHLNGVTHRWDALTRTVKDGHGAHGIEGDHDNGQFFAGFVDALFALNWPAAQMAARVVGPVQKVLDVGAGSGVWGLGFLTTHAEARLTAVDREVVVDRVTSLFARRMGVAERVSYLKGNFREVDLGQETHDVAILGHILHSEGAAHARTLLKRLHGAVKPGGCVLVAEMIPDEERNKDLFGLFFGLNMLAMTDEGCVFTRSELEGMAREAGFSKVDWIEDAPSPYPLAIFRKA